MSAVSDNEGIPNVSFPVFAPIQSIISCKQEEEIKMLRNMYLAHDI
jgi:hypothetical protein